MKVYFGLEAHTLHWIGEQHFLAAVHTANVGLVVQAHAVRT